jgi:NADPH-dependent 2,4-dienoyl-CoA reductase/sulfur reductase-like enzyme
LSAALAAAQCGAAVTVLDAYPTPGGQYYHQPPDRFRRYATARQRDGRDLWERTKKAGVETLFGTLVLNLTRDRKILLYQDSQTETAQAERIILATGAYERTAAFPGWTLPGVITAGAAQILLYQRVKPGERVLFAGAGPLQLVTAAHLLEAGVPVAAVLEGAHLRLSPEGIMAMASQWGRIVEGGHSIFTLISKGVPYMTGWGILAVHGRDQVEGATIARLDQQWRPIPGTERGVECDTVCTGYGLAPFHALAKLAGAEHVWRFDLGGEVPVRDAYLETSVPGIFCAGDGAGIGGYRMAMMEGTVAGVTAAAQLGHSIEPAEQIIRHASRSLERERRFQRFYGSLFTPGPGIYSLARENTIICRCEGITMSQLDGAVRGGATSLREVKALTRCGMGECQGRVCGQQVSHTIARITGKTPADIGLYTPRPPVFPIPVGVLASEQE